MELGRTADGVRLRLHEDPAENSCRPSVDVLFRSVARIFGSRALAVVMTGMGQDGLRGCELIRDMGGQVIVQDEASSVVWGMAGAVSQAGLAEKVLPLREIAPEIMRRVREDAATARPATTSLPPPGP
jgi:two-component system chemotaxis response regulator CheB